MKKKCMRSRGEERNYSIILLQFLWNGNPVANTFLFPIKTNERNFLCGERIAAAVALLLRNSIWWIFPNKNLSTTILLFPSSPTPLCICEIIVRNNMWNKCWRGGGSTGCVERDLAYVSDVIEFASNISRDI